MQSQSLLISDFRKTLRFTGKIVGEVIDESNASDNGKINRIVRNYALYWKEDRTFLVYIIENTIGKTETRKTAASFKYITDLKMHVPTPIAVKLVHDFLDSIRNRDHVQSHPDGM